MIIYYISGPSTVVNIFARVQILYILELRMKHSLIIVSDELRIFRMCLKEASFLDK